MLLIFAEVDIYPHPLEDSQPHLYNPVTDPIVTIYVNIADVSVIGGNDGEEIHSKSP